MGQVGQGLMGILGTLSLSQYKVTPCGMAGLAKGNLLPSEIEELVGFLIVAIVDDKHVTAWPITRRFEPNDAVIIPYAFHLHVVEVDAVRTFYTDN